MLRVWGKGTRVVLVPLPPVVGRAIDRAVAGWTSGPILLNSRGARMDRHAGTRRPRNLARVQCRFCDRLAIAPPVIAPRRVTITPPALEITTVIQLVTLIAFVAGAVRHRFSVYLSTPHPA